MSFQWFLVEGVNPEPWTASEGSVGRKGGKMWVQFHKPQQLRNYQEALAVEFVEQNPHAIMREGDLALYLYFWRQVASYETHTGRRQSANYADATNLQKSTEDALQGILYANDRQVTTTHSAIVEQGPETIPAILVGLGECDSTEVASAVILRSILLRPGKSLDDDDLPTEDVTDIF